MLEAKSLSFSYGKSKKALDDVSFSLNKGECLVLLGPNGSGKSTLLSLLIGKNKPLSGEICEDEQPITKTNGSLFSYVPQSVTGNELTVLDTILLGRLPSFKLYPNKKDKEIALGLLEEFGLSELKDKPTDEISGGERQMVAMLRCLAQDSSYLLLDEPTSNLDLFYQRKTLSLLKEEKEKGKGIIVSMHDINQAMQIGDFFLFIKEGKATKAVSREEIDEKLIEEIYGVKPIIHKENGGFITYEI